MTSCKPCALRAAGDAAAAESRESIRAQRMLLAMLNGAADATGEIAAELGGCQDCIGRLAALYLTMTATCLASGYGSADAAAKVIERGLLDDLDGPAG